MKIPDSGPISVSIVYLEVLEGLIGVGKSHVTQAMDEQEGCYTFVLKEKIPEEHLTKFYSNPVEHCAWLQEKTQEYRADQFALIQGVMKRLVFDASGPSLHVVWDRSFIGDTTFAMLNFLGGNMSVDQIGKWQENSKVKCFGKLNDTLGVFCDLKKLFTTELPLQIHFCFMYDDPARCKKRVETVRKNQSEREIPLPYYQSLHHMHCILEIAMRENFAKLPEESRSMIHFHTFSFGDYVIVDHFLEEIYGRSPKSSGYCKDCSSKVSNNGPEILFAGLGGGKKMADVMVSTLKRHSANTKSSIIGIPSPSVTITTTALLAIPLLAVLVGSRLLK